jgi:hypothetical protein
MVFIKSVGDTLSLYALQRYLILFFFIMLLLSLLFIPIIGVFLILVNKDNGVSLTSIKFIALTASIFNLFVSLIIFILFDFSTNQFQFVQEYHEISYFDFFLGIDGLSIYFILLTTIIIPISILSNWTSISKDVETYLIIILLLETLLLAVFLVLDILLFYIFFESILPPAIWSGKSLTQDLNSLYSAPIAASINGGYRTVIKQINKLRLYSTVHPKREFELDPNFVTGFVDAEGCFTVTITRDPVNKTGWRVKPAFEIGLHKKDLALLKLIQNYFNKVGIISLQSKDVVRFRVFTLKDLMTIIDHFDQYPLLTQKRTDFEFFKQIILMMGNKEHITLEGFRGIVAIRCSLNKGLSEKLKQNFPDIVPVLDL